MKTVKKCIIKVGGQDVTGLLNLEEEINEIGVPFEFIRTSVGAFTCANFDVTKHIVRGVTNSLVGDFCYQTETGHFESYDISDLSTYDSIFEFGGWIIIEEIQEIEYTPFELSKIAHCKSILLGSGSEKLIELAETF